MTAPERIWASPSVDGFLDAIDHFDASCWDMAPYVRADLYDAAVAERDKLKKDAFDLRIRCVIAEQRDTLTALAKVDAEAWHKSCAADFKALHDRLEATEAERDEAKRLLAEAVEARDEAMREAETLERERDAARAEVDLLRKVAKAADDACGAVDEEIERDALARALAAYRAAKEGKP